MGKTYKDNKLSYQDKLQKKLNKKEHENSEKLFEIIIDEPNLEHKKQKYENRFKK